MYEIFRLEAAAETETDRGLGRKCWNLILGAQENANDTLPHITVADAEWNEMAMGSLETLLAYTECSAVLDWFRAQGVRW